MPAIHVTEFAKRYIFSDDECIYRDHRRARVLADAEGSGFYSVLARDDSLEVWADGQPASLAGTFRRELLVTASRPGDATVDVVMGRTDPLSAAAVEHADPAQWAGWWVPDDGPAVPEFFGRPGIGVFVASDNPVARLCDSWSIGDTQALRERGWKVQNLSAVVPLEALQEDGTPLVLDHASHLNTASWTSPIAPDNDGVILVRRYDQFHGRQRARVWVDGVVAGWWYRPEQNRERRWAIDRFGIAPELTRGKSEIRIAIDPPAGVPLWSVAQMQVYVLPSAQKN